MKLKRVSWCAAYVSAKRKQIGINYPQTARAKDFKSSRSYSLKSVIYGIYKPKPCDIRVKSRQGGNHVDFFETDTTLIGGNVADAVTRRRWTLKSLMKDGTFAITPME